MIRHRHRNRLRPPDFCQIGTIISFGRQLSFRSPLSPRLPALEAGEDIQYFPSAIHGLNPIASGDALPDLPEEAGS
jgi:hypothetical protein